MKIARELLHEVAYALGEYIGTDPRKVEAEARQIIEVVAPLIVRRCLRALSEAQDAHILHNGNDPNWADGDKAFVLAKNILRELLHEGET